MLVLTVTAAPPGQPPAILMEDLDEVANAHPSSLGGAAWRAIRESGVFVG
jgi:hypothetical protein